MRLLSLVVLLVLGNSSLQGTRTVGHSTIHHKAESSGQSERGIFSYEIYSQLIETPEVLDKFFGLFLLELNQIAEKGLKRSQESALLADKVLEKLADIKNELTL